MSYIDTVDHMLGLYVYELRKTAPVFAANVDAERAEIVKQARGHVAFLEKRIETMEAELAAAQEAPNVSSGTVDHGGRDECESVAD